MVISHKRKPPTPGPTPEPTPGLPTLVSPTGKISGAPANNGVDWANINQYDPSYAHWGQHFALDPNYCKRMTVIESGGEDLAGGEPGSTGILQIKPAYWYDTAKQIGVSLNTPDGQIGVCCAILSGKSGHGDYGSPEANFRRLYFPSDDPASGITQDAYWAWVVGTTPAPQPTPAPQGDVLDLTFGGKPYEITATYGQLVTWSCPGCYDYQAAYGLDTKHHYAYDCVAQAGEGAPLYAAFPGIVVCAGTDTGAGSWGTGCAKFERLNNYGSPNPNGRGAGRLEILHEDGQRSLILGHALVSFVPVGKAVKPGDRIGQQGGMNASHVHIEARYANGAKIGDPRKLFGGGTLPETYDTVPYVLDAPNRNVFIVKAIKDLPMHQRADPQSTQFGMIKAGTQFEAVIPVPGQDGKEWWLLPNDVRVPRLGTDATIEVRP